MNKTIITLVLFYISYSVYSQELWNLEQCLEYAVNNSYEIKRAELELNVKDVNLQQAKENCLPNLNAEGTHKYLYGRSLNMVTNSYGTEKTISQDWYLSSRVSIFNGFVYKNTVQKSILEKELGTENLQYAMDDLKLRIMAVFFEILYNEEQVANAKNQLETSLKQKEILNELFKSGKIAEGKIFEITSQIEKERYVLLKNKNTLEASYLNLYQLLNIKNAEFDITYLVPDSLTLENFNVDSVYARTIERLPQIKSIEKQQEIASVNLEIQKGNKLPSLSLFGNVGTQYSNRSTKFIGLDNNGMRLYSAEYPYHEQLFDNWNASLWLSLEIPIYNRGVVRSNIMKAKIAVKDVEYNLLNQKDLVYLEVVKAYQDVVATYNSYLAAKEALHAATVNLDNAYERMTAGLITTTEYNTIKTEHSKTESSVIQEKYSYLYQLKMIDFYMNGF
jgi:outer membrane protein